MFLKIQHPYELGNKSAQYTGFVAPYFDFVLLFTKLLVNFQKEIQDYNYICTYYNGFELSQESRKHIEKKLSELGFECKLSHGTDKLEIQFHISDFPKEKLQTWIEKNIESYKANKGFKELQNLLTYYILEQDTIVRSHDEIVQQVVQIHKEELDEYMHIKKDEYSYDIEEDLEENIIKARFYDLLFLSLLCNGTLSSFSGPEENTDIPHIHSDYSCKIDVNFRHNSLIDTKCLEKELENLGANTQGVSVYMTAKGPRMEKTHVYYGLEKRMVELLEKYPHAEITAQVYNGKANKYTVKEKIRLDSIEK